MNRSFVLIDGFPQQKEHAVLSINDRGFLYGHGVFTTMRVQEGLVLHWESHKKRLINDCSLMAISPPSLKLEDCHRLIALNHAEKGLWKLKIIVTAGENDQNLAFGNSRKGTAFLFLDPYHLTKTSGWTLASQKLPRSPLLSRCKSLSYAENAWLLGVAKEKGADDLLICDEAGHVLETAIASIFWIVHQNLFFPSLDLPLLPGTTLSLLCHKIKQAGFHAQEAKAALSEVPPDAVWYASNALRGVVPILSIDGIQKPLNKALEKELQQLLGYRE